MRNTFPVYPETETKGAIVEDADIFAYCVQSLLLLLRDNKQHFFCDKWMIENNKRKQQQHRRGPPWGDTEKSFSERVSSSRILFGDFFELFWE